MTPCLCDPTIVCPELDCGGCECRVGTCWACTGRQERWGGANVRPVPKPCTDCQRPTLSVHWLRTHPEDRAECVVYGGLGQCDACRARRRRSERSAMRAAS